MSTLFDLAFYVAAPFWALMILAPTWRWTQRIMATPWIAAPGIVVWAIAALPVIGPLWTVVTQPNLAGLQELVTDPAAVTALWAQIIAWDLLVGRWIYRDSRRRGVHPVIMAPVLVLTILLSPIGLPVYLLLRLYWRPRAGAGGAEVDRHDTGRAAVGSEQPAHVLGGSHDD